LLLLLTLLCSMVALPARPRFPVVEHQDTLAVPRRWLPSAVRCRACRMKIPNRLPDARLSRTTECARRQSPT
jgi:hypothetical protein